MENQNMDSQSPNEGTGSTNNPDDPKKQNEEENRAEESQKPKLITLQIISADSRSKIHFKMKATTHLVKLKKAYCNQMGMDLPGLRFVFDGRRIQDDNTPLELEMDDDDQIEVYQQQIGGYTFSSFI